MIFPSGAPRKADSSRIREYLLLSSTLPYEAVLCSYAGKMGKRSTGEPVVHNVLCLGISGKSFAESAQRVREATRLGES
jgi:hypothetical protein